MEIYVSTYAKYNSGSLEGECVDPSDFGCKEEFYEYCTGLHSDESDPELMFQDIDDETGLLDLYYNESHIDAELWEMLETLSEDEYEPYAVYCNNVGDNVDYDTFQDAYNGEWESEIEFAEQLFDEIYAHDIPEGIRHYIDYEKFSRDLFMSDYSFESGYVFRAV